MSESRYLAAALDHRPEAVAPHGTQASSAGEPHDGLIDRACSTAQALAQLTTDARVCSLIEAIHRTWRELDEARLAQRRHSRACELAQLHSVRLERDALVLAQLAAQLGSPGADTVEPTGARQQLTQALGTLQRLLEAHIRQPRTGDPTVPGHLPRNEDPQPTAAADMACTNALSIWANAAGEPVPARASPMEPPPTLTVHLLGNLQVALDGQPVRDWPNGRGRSIFKYLVLNRAHPVAKDVLIETFWPDSDGTAGRNSLNVAIYGLRRALAAVNAEHSYVIFESGHYLLSRAIPIWVDSEQFEKHVQQAREHERLGRPDAAAQAHLDAVGLYRPEPLTDDRYDVWCEPLRKRSRQHYLASLDWLHRRALQRGATEEAAALLTTLLVSDPCNEAATKGLMICYSRMGQRHRALQQYRTLVQKLATEVGSHPGPGSNALFGRIQRGDDV